MSNNILLEQLSGIVPSYIINYLKNNNIKNLREIRIRAGKKTVFIADNNIFISEIYSSKEDVLSIVSNASCSSIYAFIDEIKNGFITIRGGHRIGICGRAVMKNNELANIVDFSGINIRIAKEIVGCSKEILGLSAYESMLIISPPGYGKTTILRDVSRELGKQFNVCIIDERAEISAIYKGVPQFDVGMMTDVFELCPKKLGIEIMLRSMSPQYIITDEIGKDDISAVSKGLLCGVKFIISAHGDSINDTLKRLEFDRVADKFGLVVLLGKNGTVADYVKGR